MFFRSRPNNENDVLLRIQGGDSVALSAPIYVGSSCSNDIVINSQVIADRAFVIQEREGIAIALRLDDGSVLGKNELERFGIELLGTCKRNASKLARLIALERQSAYEQKGLLRALRFADAPSGVRLAAHFCVLLAIILTIAKQGAGNQVGQITENLSRVPIDVKLGELSTKTYGNTKSFPHNPDGIIVRFKLDGSQTLSPIVVSLDAGGLDNERELVFSMQNKELFASKIMKQCVSETCPIDVTIMPDNLKVGENILYIAHSPSSSLYLARNISVIQQEPLSQLEKSELENWVEEAKEYYQQSRVAPSYLLRASEMLKRVDRLTKNRFVEVRVSIDIALLKERIALALKQVEEDYWFKINRQIQLKDIAEARASLSEMSRFFSDPTSAQYKKIQETLNSLRDLQ